jgi:hypothetical protein
VPVPPQPKSPEIESLVIVSAALPVLVSVVVKIELVWPTTTLPNVMLAGFMVRVPIAAACTVTVALACLVVSATLVAVTVTVLFAVTVGAVNIPLALTLPLVADHVTAVLLVFVTCAENCWLPPEANVAVVGETETATAAVVVVKV